MPRVPAPTLNKYIQVHLQIKIIVCRSLPVAPWPTKLSPSCTPKAASGSHVTGGPGTAAPPDVKHYYYYILLLLLAAESEIALMIEWSRGSHNASLE